MAKHSIQNQADLGTAMGRNRSTANRYLNQTSKPELSVLLQAAASFGEVLPKKIVDGFYALNPIAPRDATVTIGRPDSPKLKLVAPAPQGPATVVREIPVIRDRQAQLIGRVGGGALILALNDPEAAPIGVPADYDDAYAFRVEGDSCLPVFEPGDTVVVRGPQRAEPSEFEGRYCVVEVEDPTDPLQRLGYLKRVRPGAEVFGHGQLYNLESDNLDEGDLRILQSRRVLSARPVVLRIIGGGR